MPAITADGSKPTVVETSKRGLRGPPGVGVPEGGATGQVLAKATGDDHDTEWVDPPEGADISGKADLDSPVFTGTPRAPTAIAGTNTTQLATTAFVMGAVAALLGGAPSAALDTLAEIGEALNNDADFAATITTALSQKIGSVTTGIPGAEAIINQVVITQEDYDALDPSIQNANTFLVIEA